MYRQCPIYSLQAVSISIPMSLKYFRCLLLPWLGSHILVIAASFALGIHTLFLTVSQTRQLNFLLLFLKIIEFFKKRLFF